MADDAHFLAEIAPFLEAAQESVDELWGFTTSDNHREDELLLLELDAASEELLTPSPPQAIDGSDGANSTDTSTSEASRTTPAPRRQPSARAKRSRNSTRDNMKRELQALRAQSEELHQQLAALRHAHDERRKTKSTPSPQETLLLVSTWERIAKRRLLERTRAEEENQRLKTQVDHYSTIAANLQRSVQQFMASFAAGDPNAASTFRVHASVDTRGTRVSAEDMSICDQLIEELDDTYARLDQVFQGNGLSTWEATASNSSTAEVHMKTRKSEVNGDDLVYIELTDTDVVPYDMDLAFSLSWHCWEQRGVAKNGVLHDHVPPRVSAYKGCIDISFNGETVGLDYLNVTKWYREEGRNNCVWRGRTKVDSHFPGVYMDECGWQVIEPLPSSGDGGKIPATGSVILACSQFECKRLGGASVSLKEDEASQLAKLAVSMYENDVLEVNNMMVNMMVIDPNSTSVRSTSPFSQHPQA
ncbi:hypothetical protein FI667_g11921, partial [Globisporangium splendens]